MQDIDVRITEPFSCLNLTHRQRYARAKKVLQLFKGMKGMNEDNGEGATSVNTISGLGTYTRVLSAKQTFIVAPDFVQRSYQRVCLVRQRSMEDFRRDPLGKAEPWVPVGLSSARYNGGHTVLHTPAGGTV